MTRPLSRILVVDDDPSARLVMRSALRKAGYEVGLAVDGDDAMRQFAEQAWDMVMLDVEMPGRDGNAVCADMRARSDGLLPIVMVTGMDDVASVEKAYVSGATDFISKPINWALLGHRVRYLLRSYRAMLDLRAAEARHAAVLKAIPDPLFEIDLDGRFIDFRAPSAQLLAAPPERFLGRLVDEVLPPEAARVCMAAIAEAHATGTSMGRQIELHVPAGRRWFELSISRKAVAPGQTPRFIALSRDITERKEAERRIANMAYVDSLTGLPNRVAFIERIEREIQRARHGGGRFAVLFMDLDGFKAINDTLGHSAGDTVLQWAAERLRQGVRPSDMVSRPVGGAHHRDVELARLGGDEFTALILDVERSDDVLNVAQRIGDLMRRPFQIHDEHLSLTTSIGIAMFPDDGDDAATLIKHADVAMYQAKASGRDNAQFYGARPMPTSARGIDV